jgi:N-acetyl-anhydromuramyl-L-alanine amidase AmpD
LAILRFSIFPNNKIRGGKIMLQRDTKLKFLVFTFGLLVLFLAAVPVIEAQNDRQKSKVHGLEKAFKDAAEEFGVPSEILKTIAYAETRFDGHNGEPSQSNGYGLMHLADNNENQSLNRAAAILGVPADVLKKDDRQNIRGGAAILRALADEEFAGKNSSAKTEAWYPVVARYSHAADATMAKFYADEIYRLLQRGFSGTTRDGEEIIMAATEIEPLRGRYENVPSLEENLNNAVASTDYAPALWSAAYSGNYLVANRPTSSAINYVIIHTTQGSYSGTINWFKNSAANVSAHYVIRSSDGQITQMVREKDVAYHVRSYNSSSVGIEHEGFVDNPSWYTDAMYRASAALTRNICQKYGLALTRTHVKGHSEMPGNDHSDPGPNWNWTYYMQLVAGSSWETIVDNATSGGFSASGNWATSTYSTQRYGADYRYANPQPVSDAAWFSANIPSAGNYEVFVRYPANSGYNSATPFVVAATGGNAVVNVNQQINGATWVSIGTHSLNAGSQQVVGVSRWTNAAGYVIADAVKIVRR